MDLQILIHELISSDLNRCEKLYKVFCRRFKELPKGSLVCRHSKYYHVFRANGKQKFIPTDSMDRVKDLKTRRYIKDGLPLLRARIKICRDFLEHEKIYDPKALEQSLPACYHDLSDINVFLENDINIDEWMSKPYKRNPMEIRTPHYTAGGNKVRSKSEAMIGSRLEDHSLFFICEPELSLSSKKVYPDFLIYLPNKRRFVYWEHLGMVDDPQYMMRNLIKLDEYAKNGFYLGINLIITYETRERPLTIVDIDNKINFLLDIDHNNKKA